jgi:hypothetical protein
MIRMQHILAGAAIWIAAAGMAMAEPDVKSEPLPTSTDVMPWYRAFTLRSDDVSNGAFLPLKRPDMEIRATSQWGITIGLEEQDPLLDSTDRMSAGAFFDISPRVRLGGELTFTAPGELRTSTPQDRVLSIGPIAEEPVVRVESSIKF